jgi:hypothetical protein
MEMVKRRYKVERSEINYISVIISSYDGVAFTQTLDSHEAIIELGIAPHCVGLVKELLASLARDEDIRLEEISY